jgi:hypothetical protein
MRKANKNQGVGDEMKNSKDSFKYLFLKDQYLNIILDRNSFYNGAQINEMQETLKKHRAIESEAAA